MYTGVMRNRFVVTAVSALELPDHESFVVVFAEHEGDSWQIDFQRAFDFDEQDRRPARSTVGSDATL